MSKSVLAVLGLAIGTLASPAASETVSKQEALLRKAMQPGPSTDDNGGRALSPGVAIRAYVKSGHLRRKPEERADYVDYRLFRKPASLFGHKLVMIEEEYMTQYIGCCVNRGLGVIIEVKGSTTELQAFVTESKCTIDHLQKPEDIFLNLNIKASRGATYHYISCREDDLMKHE